MAKPLRSPRTNPRWKQALALAGLELGYFTGVTRLLPRRTGGLGIIIKFERVRPRDSRRFQPLRSGEITPEFLDRALAAFRRWKFDVVAIGEVAQRLQSPTASRRRFVALTFDGGYRDFFTHAYPILARHKAPATIYLPSSFPDGLGELWWLALEQVVARNDRIAFLTGSAEQRLSCEKIREKREAFSALYDWLRSLPQSERSEAIRDLCGRYQVDLKAVSQSAVMDWEQVNELAADPLVTIGTATLNYPVLARTLNDVAEREMRMGRAVLEAALGRSAGHFAYPFGDNRALGRRHVLIASQLGFSTAVTTQAGVVAANERMDLMALPRITWDGRRQSLRAMRVILSGITVAGRQHTPPAD